MMTFFSFTLTLLVFLLASVSFAGATQKECAKYSDRFDTYRPDRWQEVLLYSEAPADLAVEDGRLRLRSPRAEPCEIQVYSLFTLAGDFDIQADYDLTGEADLSACRFNAGLALQTPGDEKSYKCYVAMTPGKGLLFRSRLDRFGERNVEIHKGDPAPRKGTLRVVREDNRLTFLALLNGQWRKIYDFQGACAERLRVRFKLQTGGDEDESQACPLEVHFDNFVINACDKIAEE